MRLRYCKTLINRFKLSRLKSVADAELIRGFKNGLWVNYSIADGSGSPYAANMIGNLIHWLEDSSEIKQVKHALPGIDRFDIVGKQQKIK